MSELSYLDLLREISEKGTDEGNRTGIPAKVLTGTTVFADLQQGFPLFTTKKMHFKALAHELLWFLSGDTNVRYLQDAGVRIWNEWVDTNGNLGPIYGHQWRNFGGPIDNVWQPPPVLPRSVAPNYLDVGEGVQPSDIHDLTYAVWTGLLERCYNKRNDRYVMSGLRGDHVCNRWLQYSNFRRDAPLLPGWPANLTSDTRMVLDKDILGSGFSYDPESCCWIVSYKHQAPIRPKPTHVFRLYHINGTRRATTSLEDFSHEYQINLSSLRALINDNSARVAGWSLLAVTPVHQGVDQIYELIQNLRTDPDSRRMVVTAWNPKEVGMTGLPCCHVMFQCLTRTATEEQQQKWRLKKAEESDFDEVNRPTAVNAPKRVLDMVVTQRSADMFLGVPFNLASYALLTEMLAQVTYMIPGRVRINFGSSHNYTTHLQQIEVQLRRTPHKAPSLYLNPKIEEIGGFTFEDIEVRNYTNHPTLPAPVAV